MTTKSKIALGVVGAIAAGVVIGLLVAPDKGSDTRKKIKKASGDWADKLGHLFVKAKDGVAEAKKHRKAIES